MTEREREPIRGPFGEPTNALTWPPVGADTDRWVHRLGAIVHTMREGLQVLDRDFRYLYVNEAAARHGIRTRGELLGHTLPEMYPGVEETELWTHLTRCMRERVSHAMDNEFAFPDGTRRFFELRMEPVPEGLLILSVDVTARRSLEVQLARAQKMEALGRLAGGVAHDFNNFLTVISSYAEMLDAPSLRAADRHEFAGQIRQAAARAARLTRQLLTLGRGQMVRVQTIEVDQSVGALGSMLRLLAGERVRVTLRQGAPGVSVRMDPAELDQVLLNLVSNAHDAMPEGGRLVIESSTARLGREEAEVHEDAVPGAYVRIVVRDSGIGMDAATVQRVFEPFFTTKSGERGTGLGLATSQEIVRKAGGFITVASAPGEGSTFVLYLPVAAAGEQAEAEAAAAAEFESSAERGEVPQVVHGRVLVVDDDAALRQLCCRTLADAGFEVEHAGSVNEALEMVRRGDLDFDVVVSDVVLPDGAGPELAAALAAERSSPRVLFMSGYARRALLRSIDPAHFLAKPFTPGELLAKLRRVLGSR